MCPRQFSAQEVRETREQYGMTQNQLANELGVTTTTIQNFEAGRVGIRSQMHRLMDEWLNRVAAQQNQAKFPQEEQMLLRYADLLKHSAEALTQHEIDVDHRIAQGKLNLDYILGKLREMSTTRKKP